MSRTCIPRALGVALSLTLCGCGGGPGPVALSLHRKLAECRQLAERPQGYPEQARLARPLVRRLTDLGGPETPDSIYWRASLTLGDKPADPAARAKLLRVTSIPDGRDEEVLGDLLDLLLRSGELLRTEDELGSVEEQLVEGMARVLPLVGPVLPPLGSPGRLEVTYAVSELLERRPEAARSFFEELLEEAFAAEPPALDEVVVLRGRLLEADLRAGVDEDAKERLYELCDLPFATVRERIGCGEEAARIASQAELPEIEQAQLHIIADLESDEPELLDRIVQARFYLAENLMEAGSFVEAGERYREILEGRGGSRVDLLLPVLLRRYAEALEKTGDVQEACRALAGGAERILGVEDRSMDFRKDKAAGLRTLARELGCP